MDYDAIKFLETACRNWPRVPKLSKSDVNDVAIALAEYKETAIADLRARNDALIEMCAKVVDNHRPDASFDDSASGAMERNALLDNVAAEIRALAANREG